MKTCLLVLLSFAFVLAGAFGAPARAADTIAVTILYDNYDFAEGLETDWGYSCIVRGTQKTVLFDTGAKRDIFLRNIEKLNVDPKEIESVVISHNHGDHTGGLTAFLEKHSDVSVYLPISFPQAFVKQVKRTGAEVMSVDEPVEICKGVYLTGEMGDRIKEQALILDTDRGLVLITGCSHPGIVDILKRAREVLNRDIYLVFGGFHLLRKSDDQVREIIDQFKDLGVQKVGATHCTGDKAIAAFREGYGANFVQIGVGKVIEIPARVPASRGIPSGH